MGTHQSPTRVRRAAELLDPSRKPRDEPPQVVPLPPAPPWGLPAPLGASTPALPPAADSALPGEPCAGASVGKAEVPRDATPARGSPGAPVETGAAFPEGGTRACCRAERLHTLPPPKVESQEESKQSRILSSLPPGRSVQFPSRGMCCEMWGRLARGAHAKPSGCSGAHQASVSRAPSLPRGSRGEIGTERGTCTWSCYPEGHQDLLSRGFCNVADPGEQGAVVFWPVLLPYIHPWPILGDTETFLPHGH